MEIIVILMSLTAIGVVAYLFISSYTETRDKKMKESESTELRQQVTSLNVKLQKLEFEHSALQKETEEAKDNLQDTKNELETLRKRELALNDEAGKLKETERKNESTISLLKAENVSLKEKLMDKENETKKMIAEIKVLREKLSETYQGTSWDAPKKDENPPNSGSKDTSDNPDTPTPE
jgi:chromosome segregation ATPase